MKNSTVLEDWRMDKQIVIYGSGNVGKYVFENMSKEIQDKVRGWIDNNRGYYSIFNSRYVWTEDEYAVDRQEEDIYVCIQNQTTAQERVVSMLNKGWDNIYALDSNVFSAKLPIMEGEKVNGCAVRHYTEIKPELPYLECHVTDICNLKCRNCFHFCNLDEYAEHCDLKEFRSSLTALKEKFSNISVLRLMGGEPLLNPELPQYIYVAREIFPRAEIRVVTNGLLILNISEELTKAMNMCCAIFDVTQYPPVVNKAYEVIDFLEQRDIRYQLTAPVTHFYARLSKENSNPEQAFRFCPHQCHFLRKGRLYLCTQIPMLYEHKEYFGIEIDEKEYQENGINLIKSGLSGWDILKRFSKMSSFCRFCSDKKRIEAWEAGKAKEGDWYV